MDREQCITLLSYLKRVADYRKARGRHYEWLYLLTLVCAALLSGAKSGQAIADWIGLHGSEIRACLKVESQRLPSVATVYRLLRHVPIEQLEQILSEYGLALQAADRSSGRILGAEGSELRGYALDGKTIRGAGAHGAKCQVVRMVAHGSGLIVGQGWGTKKRSEGQMVRRLLAGRDWSGTVVTLDALHPCRSLARQVLDQRGDYVLIVKPNRRQLGADIDLLFQSLPAPWDGDERLSDRQTGKQHGRIDTRTVTSSLFLNDYLDWPGVQQVLRRTCRRVNRRTGQVTEEVTYAITSLSRQRAGPPHLQALWRGHWTIENRDQYVLDHTLGEDACQMHTGTAPQAWSALRSALLNLLRHHGWHNIAAALRFYAASPAKALALLGATTT